jgi:hypothetical protein
VPAAAFSLIMPSATSTSNSTDRPASRIPAWQRLGLKLKSATEPPPIILPSPDIDSPKRKRTAVAENTLPSKKIKWPDISASGAEPPITPQLLRKKSVTFTPETKIDDGDSIKQLFNTWAAEQKAQDPAFDFKSSSQAFDTPEPVKVQEHVDTGLREKERRVRRAQKSDSIVNKPKDTSKSKKPKSGKVSKIVKLLKPTSRPFLDYIKQYHEDRASWKFNKNHQNHLLKNIFDLNVIPSDYAHLIYYYVRGLQGGVRTRLRDTAISIKVKDIEDGAAGFGDKMALDISRQKQLEYESCCKEFVAHMTQLDASTKMGYEEGQLAGLSDYAMKKRVAKRTRAEWILQNLASGDGGEFGDNTSNKAAQGEDDSQKRLRMTENTSKKIARKRKQRTTVDDDTSTSGESSGTDSDSDSSSEESDDEPAPGASARETNHDTSSSSSSSSSEESEDSEDSDSSDDSEDNEN